MTRLNALKVQGRGIEADYYMFLIPLVISYNLVWLELLRQPIPK